MTHSSTTLSNAEPRTEAQKTALSVHLQRLRTTREIVRSVLEVADPNHETASASLAITWELVFGTLCLLDVNHPPELGFISDFVSVLQKLTSSYNQLKTLELKMQDSVREDEKRALTQTLEDAREKAPGLSAELLEQIETSLKLL
ncbi:MAG: hypothetical protein B7X06_00065 [Verrucomicrobia bacterium 21-51-4]|nr:MAG: hypothetical protein B7X06_00065 [Verrucomicrobia bacterium 21-51-4]HQU08361.1 hypothetical protein [Opitutales bacterium]